MTEQNNKPFISVVSPVYGAENIVDELVRQLAAALQQVTDRFEIVLVDDRSPDQGWLRIQENANQFASVKGVRLSRNFGQHAAILAGLAHCQGDYCIVMDCDLQDNPAYIPALYKASQSGVDIVFTRVKDRQHGWWKNLTSSLFYKVFDVLADSNIVRGDTRLGNYTLISRPVINAFLSYGDYQFHYLQVLRWLGFSRTYVEIEHQSRFEGESAYTLKKLIDHAMVAIVYQSDRLLKVSIYLGVTAFVASILVSATIVVLYFTQGFMAGWASLFVLTLFMSGAILVSIGVLGLYLGRTFEQVKGRPRFVVDETRNL